MNAFKQNRGTVLIGTATAFSLLGDQVLYSVLPVYHGELGLSAIQVGVLLSANRWIRLVTNELAHRLPGNRSWFVATFVLGAATTFAYTLTTSFAALLAARLAWGLAWSYIRHVGVLSIMSQTDPAKPGRTMGLYNGISRVGSVAGLLGGALLVDVLGFAQAMVLLAALSLLAVPFAVAGYAPTQTSSHAQGEARISAHYLVLAFVLGAVGPGLVMATLGAVLAEWSVLPLGLSAATLTGAVLAIRFALDTGVAPYLGALTDRFGLKAAGLGFFGAGTVCLAVAATADALALVVVAIIGFFVSGTALSAGIGGTVGRLGSAPFARYVTVYDLGSASGPIIGWLAYDQYGEPWLGLAIGAALYLLSFAVLLGIPARGTR